MNLFPFWLKELGFILDFEDWAKYMCKLNKNTNR